MTITILHLKYVHHVFPFLNVKCQTERCYSSTGRSYLLYHVGVPKPAHAFAQRYSSLFVWVCECVSVPAGCKKTVETVRYLTCGGETRGRFWEERPFLVKNLCSFCFVQKLCSRLRFFFFFFSFLPVTLCANVPSQRSSQMTSSWLLTFFSHCASLLLSLLYSLSGSLARYQKPLTRQRLFSEKISSCVL